MYNWEQIAFPFHYTVSVLTLLQHHPECRRWLQKWLNWNEWTFHCCQNSFTAWLLSVPRARGSSSDNAESGIISLNMQVHSRLLTFCCADAILAPRWLQRYRLFALFIYMCVVLYQDGSPDSGQFMWMSAVTYKSMAYTQLCSVSHENSIDIKLVLTTWLDLAWLTWVSLKNTFFTQ